MLPVQVQDYSRSGYSQHPSTRDRNNPVTDITNSTNDDTISIGEITEKSVVHANTVATVIADYCVTANIDNTGLVDTVVDTDLTVRHSSPSS